MDDTLHYEIVGEGDLDILLVHGWASSARIFNRIVEDLRDVGRFWMVDLAGHGQSTAGELPATVNTHVDLLREFCHKHDLRPDVVIAHSMGGMITLKLALAEPDLFASQILICPVVTGDVGRLHVKNLVNTPPVEFVLRHSEVFWHMAQEPLWEKILFPLPFSAMGNEPLRHEIWEDFRRADWATSIECLLSITHENLEPDLHKIEHPALVIVGDGDVTVSPSEGRLAAAQMPKAELLACAESRHLPHEEQPALMMPAIREFIQQHHEVSA